LKRASNLFIERVLRDSAHNHWKLNADVGPSLNEDADDDEEVSCGGVDRTGN